MIALISQFLYLQQLILLLTDSLTEGAPPPADPTFRPTLIKTTMEGLAWAQGGWGGPDIPTYFLDFQFLDSAIRDEIVVTIYNTYEGAIEVVDTQTLRLKNKAEFQFDLKNYPHRDLERYLGVRPQTWKVILKPLGEISSHNYNCLEVATEYFVHQSNTYQQRFTVEGTKEIEDNLRLHKRRLDGLEASAKLIEVFVKGHRRPMVFQTNTDRLSFHLRSSSVLTIVSILTVCVWAGKHYILITASKAHDLQY